MTQERRDEIIKAIQKTSQSTHSWGVSSQPLPAYLLADDEPEKPVATIPDFTEPVLACRAWRVEHSIIPGTVFRLVSLNQPGVWGSGVNEAECPPIGSTGRYRSHLPPAHTCKCGIYAVADPKHLEEWIEGKSGIVVGVVELWGRIIPGDRGYRAEYAKIRELVTFPRAGWLKRHRASMYETEMRKRTLTIAKLYGLPVRTDWPQLTDPKTLHMD